MTSSKKKSKSKPNNQLTVEEVTAFLISQPDDVQEEVAQELLTGGCGYRSMEYSGPIPHPQLLREFNDVIPDGANRIMIMAEKQSEHRRNLEEKIVNANNRDSLLGIIFALVIALVIVGSGTFLLFNDKEVSGMGLLLSGIGTFITVFIVGKRNDDKQHQEQEQE